MTMQIKRLYCEDCDRMVKAERPAFNHLLHLLVSIFLCGFWLPVWALLAIGYTEPYRCSRCALELARPFDLVRWSIILAGGAFVLVAASGVVAVLAAAR